MTPEQTKWAERAVDYGAIGGSAVVAVDTFLFPGFDIIPVELVPFVAYVVAAGAYFAAVKWARRFKTFEPGKSKPKA